MSDEPRPDPNEQPLSPPPLPVLPVPAIPFGVPPPPPPPSRMRRAWLIVLGVVLLVVLVGLPLVYVRKEMLAARARSAAMKSETAEQKYREARAAFSTTAPASSDAPDVAPADRVAIEAAFARLAAAVRSGNSPATAAMMDSERMTAELEGQAGFPRMSRVERRQFVGGMDAGFARNLAQQLAIMGWSRHRFGRIKKLGPNEAVAYVRHYDDTGLTDNMRWWWHKGASGWRVYDYEELHTGTRLSRFMLIAVAAAGRGGAPPPWLSRAQNVGDANRALAAGNLDAAEKAVKAMEGQTFPPEIEMMRLIAKGNLQLHRADYPAAIETYNRAAALQPDSAAPRMGLAKAHHFLGEHEDAIRHADAYLAALGPDPDNLMTKAASLEALGRFDEAADTYRAALDDDPDAPEHLAALATLSGKSEMHDVAERFKRSSRSVALFDKVAGAMEQAPDVAYDEAALTSVVAAFREALARGRSSADAGATALADMIEAGVHARAGRHERAASIAREALLLGVPDDGALTTIAPDAAMGVRAGLQRRYLTSMHAMKKSVEAYRAAPDHATAFRTLANLAHADSDADALLKLAAARKADAPGDPVPDIFIGHAHGMNDAYDKADEAYAAAARKAKSRSPAGFTDGDRDALRYSQLHARYMLGRSPTALKDFPPAWDAFRQLAAMHLGDKDADGLAKLIDAYRPRASGDASLVRWQAELARMRKDYAKAVDLYLEFEKLREAQPAPEPGSMVSAGPPGPEPAYDWAYVENNLTDCLLSAGRTDEALARAQRNADAGGHFQLLWVHAHLGNVPEATAAFKKMVDEQGSMPIDLYADESVGPLLRDAKFKPLHAAYPIPKELE